MYSKKISNGIRKKANDKNIDERKKLNKIYYFFIGTEAELIKLLPVLNEFEKRNIPYTTISSGQNNISKSLVLKLLKKRTIDIVLFDQRIKQTVFGLFTWFLKTSILSMYTLRKEFSKANKKDKIMIVHGDTVSTVMGSLIAKRYGLRLAHVEAGLRSFNFLHPFPEEIDRVITSQFTEIHFSPNQWAVNNLRHKRGIKVNTYENTLLESLNIVINTKVQSSLLDKIKKEKYFLFIMHRQENLFNDQLVELLIEKIIENARFMKCVFVMHAPTIVVLEKKNLIKKLRTNKNIILSERLQYIEFMKILDRCEYIITDGGSNQEESYYFGKPCLILRSATERIEGLDENVVLSKNNFDTITDFFNDYKKYIRKPIRMKKRPSEIIVDALTKPN